MSDRTFNLAVFIGRFSPLHLGHCHVISTALEYADKICILVGSSFTPRSYRNPWSFDERKEMIVNTFKDIQDRIIVLPLEDFAYNDSQWIQNVQQLVSEVVEGQFSGRYPRITLIGHNKDNSSYYLKLFPQWASINVPGYVNEDFVLASTNIREWYFSNYIRIETQHLPPAVCDFLEKFNKTTEYKNIVEEYEFIRNYKKSWESAPKRPLSPRSFQRLLSVRH